MDNDTYAILARQKVLNDLFEKMSDDEKKLFILYSLQKRSTEDIMQRLDDIQSQVERNKYSFTTDLLANVSGNFVADSLIWLGAQLFKRIRP